ncbi:hypothetical protein [Halobellus rubicundus]|uniref:DUF8081 domain-containing protein n=1 Tax=Halobellus rubicundus TaxID=2996466 RepID=A0ABD5M7I0_9EURY
MSESYLVEVKKSVLVETSLTPKDFDPVSNLTLTDDFDERILMEFTSPDDAREWINTLNPKLSHRVGRLSIYDTHPQDESEVDAYLRFSPRH